MKELFLSRLPSSAQLVLASTKDELDMQNLTTLADRILEVSTTAPSSSNLLSITEETAKSSDLHELKQQIQHLSCKLEEMQTHIRGRSESRGRQQHFRRQSRSPSRDKHVKDDVCWYHRTFGKHARKCNQPCSSGNANANN
ncbi:uncharacterized protein LOC117107205 [Anneissia japonica]|uniref:uncharacterized protein LOC117107205 n=1 Tax=Anneissia japonica TaxID=1529436 RepID=UPI001425A5B0|nr:uncharacterized protein LOC117107205 [Anneissia japonica]